MCATHGAKQVRKACDVDGCERLAVRKGRCCTHGAGKAGGKRKRREGKLEEGGEEDSGGVSR